MILIDPDCLDLLLLENQIWLAVAQTDVATYDFHFDKFFACRRPYQRPDQITAIGRFGVTTEYSQLYQQLQTRGISLIHNPTQYRQASELTEWYPLISELTARSKWYQAPPTIAEIEQDFHWPIFIKGSRQTSRHRAALSIIRSPADYQQAITFYQQDAILRWQTLIVREYLTLRLVPGQIADKVPPAFEFRTFWWQGRLVGAGPYWSPLIDYHWTAAEQFAAISIAEKAAAKIALPFIVIDVAQLADGRWIVIECNDGQESGYAGISPILIWQNIVQWEKRAENHEGHEEHEV